MCLQSQHFLADEQAQQMVLQAHTLLQRRRLTRQPGWQRQNGKLLQKLHNDTPELGLHPSEGHS